MNNDRSPTIELPQHVPCAICGVDDAKPQFHPPRSCGPVVQCRRCGLVYVNPRESAPWAEQLPSAAQDRTRQIWATDWFRRYLAEGEWKKDNFRRSLERLRHLGAGANDGRPPRLLDFGCAVGLFLQVAIETGWQAFGIEPDTALAQYARETWGLRVFNGLLSEAGFPPAFFDTVVSVQVFEHLPDPATELRQIARVLRPGGLLMIDVPSIDNIWYRLLRGRHRHFATPQHLYFYTPATMSRLLEQAGFEIVDLSFPARSLSLEHICKHHLALYSSWASSYLSHVLERLGWSQRSVSINLRDIVCVCGRKA